MGNLDKQPEPNQFTFEDMEVVFAEKDVPVKKVLPRVLKLRSKLIALLGDNEIESEEELRVRLDIDRDFKDDYWRVVEEIRSREELFDLIGTDEIPTKEEILSLIKSDNPGLGMKVACIKSHINRPTRERYTWLINNIEWD